MSDKLVLAGAFAMPVEAQLARGLLEAEGIKTLLTGGGSVNVFSGVQGLGGQIQLQVSEADAARAVEILAPHFDHHEDAADPGAETDAALWLCPLCGDAVSDDLEFCPACETARPAARSSHAVTAPRPNSVSQDIQQEEPVFLPEKITSDAPHEAAPSALDGDLDVPDMETLVGDDLVRRVFRSSLISLLVPILTPYSFWLLMRLAFYPGKISPGLLPRLYWAVAIGAFWGLCLLMLLLMFFADVLAAMHRF